MIYLLHQCLVKYILVYTFVVYVCAGFLKLIIEENVDIVAKKCPYILERCIGVAVQAAIQVSDFSRADRTALMRSGVLTSVLLQSTSAQLASRHACFEMVWRSLRMIRGVPSEVIAALSDRLGGGVFQLIR